ncbi:hypothetical protein Cst_c04420 [Thermoclostridium stercorarium subsp. stercorarium DSM 8532]|uniref:Uncharacterized protein n=1 Tax=Thermoclostridium stercorarium (strain ATCC 35414 / DSM 8532 / NCIMB 11754) TaxID=1121335 RepID=L7VLD9_THES1|nr:hypothetical protein Cst_c04420 [Thermoclostridium stercorarium subsp. stercorarium DSM 8532]
MRILTVMARAQLTEILRKSASAFYGDRLVRHVQFSEYRSIIFRWGKTGMMKI